MARRKAPQNKTHAAAPENGSAPEDEQSLLLTALAEKDAQLRRLLKAENNEFVGTVGRMALRNVAEDIRAELRGSKEVDMGGTDDGA